MPSRIPQAPEAEAAVLGAVLLRNDAFDTEGVSDLQPDDFHLPKNGAVWAAMRGLLHGGHPVDIVTLEQQLQTDETIGLVGGLEGLGKLADRYATTHNVGEHARIVTAKARARRTQRILSEAGDRLGNIDADDLDDFIAETQGEISKIEAGATATFLTVGEAAQRAMDQAKARSQKRLTPYGFGIQSLDQLLDGGMMPAELVVLAARPAMGKTVLGYGAFQASSCRGEVPLMFALEMSEEETGRRAIVADSATHKGLEIGMRDVKVPGTDRGWHAMARAVERLKARGGYIFFDRLHIDKMVAIARKWRRQVKQSGNRPGPIIVDYLQLIDAFGADRKLTRNDFIGRLTRELKHLAKELRVPVLLLAQVNRECEKRDNKRPRVSDLRESGSIEQDANTILFLYRDAIYNPGEDPNTAEIIAGKARSGVIGTVNVRFEGWLSRFLDAIPESA